jgi:hypothetical protein
MRESVAAMIESLSDGAVGFFFVLMRFVVGSALVCGAIAAGGWIWFKVRAQIEGDVREEIAREREEDSN